MCEGVLPLRENRTFSEPFRCVERCYHLQRIGQFPFKCELVERSSELEMDWELVFNAHMTVISSGQTNWPPDF